ncbi:hypothetical protein EVAR_71166_1, partial [Eumeta japonica]
MDPSPSTDRLRRRRRRCPILRGMTDSPHRTADAASATPDRPLAAMHLSVDVGFAVLLVVWVATSRITPSTPSARSCSRSASGPASRTPALRSPVTPERRRVGIVVTVLLWLPLVVLAPSFGWCAFPLFFALHRSLTRRVAVIGSALLVVAVSTGLFFMSNGEDLGLVLGPFFGGLMLSFAVDALERALDNRRRLNTELLATQAQLARSEREAGALAVTVSSEQARGLPWCSAPRARCFLESGDAAPPRDAAPTSEAREILREALIETRQLMHGLAD